MDRNQVVAQWRRLAGPWIAMLQACGEGRFCRMPLSAAASGSAGPRAHLPDFASCGRVGLSVLSHGSEGVVPTEEGERSLARAAQ